jgi:hypothetical protein
MILIKISPLAGESGFANKVANDANANVLAVGCYAPQKLIALAQHVRLRGKRAGSGHLAND